MLDQLDLEDVSNGWQALAFVASVAFVSFFSWGMMKVKRTADKDAEKAAPALEAAQQAIDLKPAVQVLSTQVAELRQEVAELKKFKDVKYPAALDHITTLHCADPELTLRFPIPRILREDMDG